MLDQIYYSRQQLETLVCVTFSSCSQGSADHRDRSYSNQDNENRHLVECSSSCNKKAIAVGKNIHSIGLYNQRKLKSTTTYICRSCGKLVTYKD